MQVRCFNKIIAQYNLSFQLDTNQINNVAYKIKSRVKFYVNIKVNITDTAYIIAF